MQCTAGSCPFYRLGMLRRYHFAKWGIACSFCRMPIAPSREPVRSLLLSAMALSALRPCRSPCAIPCCNAVRN
eukprot:714150-Pleurochrysis_carterae.AAC.5